MTSKKDELMAKANKPAEEAMKLHPFYQGKVEVALKSPVRDVDDFSIWYTPGVAAPCKAIAANKDDVYKYTNKGNFVAVVSDGTRVLGLGDIGPEASMPVMEGKALLFKYLGGVDAFPICVDTKDPDELIKFVKMLQPSFGGINLEDIASPKCFYILDRLREECHIPVWHDDQQGTALVTLAGLINALKIVGKKIDQVKIVMNGAGAANLCTIRLFLAAGVDPGKVIMVDSKGTLHKGRTDLEKEHPLKWEMCLKTNAAGVVGGTEEAMKGADVLIALSKPGPGTIKKEWVASMADKAIVFACANPNPEIWPWEAKEAGAAIVATGRSDFPNQVNNSLGFPAIFRGVLDVHASTITDGMCIAAAEELAACAPNGGMDPEKILPTMDMWEVFPRVATATAMKAIEEGVARLKLSRDEIYKKAEATIRRSQELTRMMMKEGLIAPAP
ncbi:MAG: NADP-dependent malic enzyme [Firmicutes bacterium]|jgi:malate dehydrogenase (oxaloacetate-decarboxylating)|nr:NADP-dependent malic enzyme [Bacillota bacterium]HPU01958.1 NADP-dependent malic enzyme [Bacillota bacterium]